MIGHLHAWLARFMGLRRTGKSQEINHNWIVDALEPQDPGLARQTLLDDIETSRGVILDEILEGGAASYHLDN